MTSRSQGPSGPLTSPLHSISFYIGRAHYAYVALLKRLLAEEGLDAHVRPGMGHILFALFEEDDLIIRDLAHRVQLSPSTMTGMLTRMERGGLIVRTRDADDGRAMRVQLTSLGRSLEEPCRRVLARLNDILEAPMTSQEIVQVKNGFATVVAQLRRLEQRVARAARKARPVVLTTIGGLVLVAEVAWAQATFGAITGTVSDTSGSVLPGTTVVITADDRAPLRVGADDPRGSRRPRRRADRREPRETRSAPTPASERSQTPRLR